MIGIISLAYTFTRAKWQHAMGKSIRVQLPLPTQHASQVALGRDSVCGYVQQLARPKEIVTAEDLVG